MAILEQINHRIVDKFSDLIKKFKKEFVVDISQYLQKELVVFLHATARDEALKRLVDVIEDAEKVSKEDHFFQAILEREKIVSTGIGLGTAIPHAKKEGINDFFICIGIQKGNGLEWQSLDQAPVRIIFMIGGPENRQTEYLQILSKLTQAIKNESLRKKILQATSSEEILRLFQNY